MSWWCSHATPRTLFVAGDEPFKVLLAYESASSETVGTKGDAVSGLMIDSKCAEFDWNFRG